MSSLAFVGGRILTMDPALPQAEAVVVTNGRIAAVGERRLLEAWPDSEVNDLEGRTLLPGFIDAHTHLSLAALHPLWADLSEARDLEDVGAALREQAKQEPEAAWARGVGWEGKKDWLRLLTRHDLDALDLGRPVIVVHFSLHMCVVCSRGLEALGIGRNTPDPPGGLIDRDPKGQPTGLLVERAWS